MAEFLCSGDVFGDFFEVEFFYFRGVLLDFFADGACLEGAVLGVGASFLQAREEGDDDAVDHLAFFQVYEIVGELVGEADFSAVLGEDVCNRVRGVRPVGGGFAGCGEEGAGLQVDDAAVDFEELGVGGDVRILEVLAVEVDFVDLAVEGLVPCVDVEFGDFFSVVDGDGEADDEHLMADEDGVVDAFFDVEGGFAAAVEVAVDDVVVDEGSAVGELDGDGSFEESLVEFLCFFVAGTGFKCDAGEQGS